MKTRWDLFFGPSECAETSLTQSMLFQACTDASKVALVFLMEWINKNGYTIVDCQFINNHLLQFGAKEIPQEEFLVLLEQAME